MKPILFVGLAMILTGGAARADEIPELTRYLEQQTASMVEAMSCDGASCASTAETEDAYYFKRLMIRVRPKASFGVPGFAKLEIAPETELVWDRKFPDGWTGYKPTP